jgi:hypothetical protein
MKCIALVSGLALVFSASAFAQEAPQNPPVAEAKVSSNPAPPGHYHSLTVYHGPHRYPMKTRGRAGDPRIVDHSADTLIVEPTHSTITVMVDTR